MKSLLTAFAFLALSSTSFAFPGEIQCRNVNADGSITFHQFSVRDTGREVFPPIVEVHLFSQWLEHPSDHPNDPVSSEDPNPNPGNWVTRWDETVIGSGDLYDRDLVHLPNGGFLKYLGGDRLTFRLPGVELPTTIGNCLLPEVGMTVHN